MMRISIQARLSERYMISAEKCQTRRTKHTGELFESIKRTNVLGNVRRLENCHPEPYCFENSRLRSSKSCHTREPFQFPRSSLPPETASTSSESLSTSSCESPPTLSAIPLPANLFESCRIVAGGRQGMGIAERCGKEFARRYGRGFGRCGKEGKNRK
jgi:hypothetical protein